MLCEATQARYLHNTYSAQCNVYITYKHECSLGLGLETGPGAFYALAKARSYCSSKSFSPTNKKNIRASMEAPIPEERLFLALQVS